jgi:hypothetical protein
MILADQRFRQPTVISLITAVFVCFGLCALPAGGESGRKAGAFGKAGVSQVAKELPTPGGTSYLEDEITGESGGIELPMPPCWSVAGTVAGITSHLPRMMAGAVRGRAPPVHPLT